MSRSRRTVYLAYLDAVEGVFGADVDFAQLIKVYGPAQGDEHERRYSPATCRGTRVSRVTGTPDRDHISTSYIERQNLNIRMQNRRFTRLTNAFSKKLANHAYQVALYTVFYNFCRIHTTLKTTPATAAGLTGEVRDVEWIVGLVEARTPPPGPRGPYRKPPAQSPPDLPLTNRSYRDTLPAATWRTAPDAHTQHPDLG